MKIRDAIAMADAARYNTFEEITKIRWLSKLDGQIHQEVILTHAHTQAQETFDGYDASTDTATVLLIPAPYDAELYPLYLQLMMDKENAESERYNQSATLFNQALISFQDWYNRTHLSLHGGRRFLF